MKIEKATDELEYPDWLITTNHTPEYDEAVQLGIEALKRIGVGRRTGRFSWEDKLPGETEK